MDPNKDLFICCRCGYIKKGWGDCQSCPNDDLTSKTEVIITYNNCIKLLKKFEEYERKQKSTPSNFGEY